MSYTRTNTVQITFSRNQPRPTAFEIHEWIVEELKLVESDIYGIQLDFIINTLFLKLHSSDVCEKLVSENGGKREFKYPDGSVQVVNIQHSGYGVRSIRVFNLPFEIPNDEVTRVMKMYGTVMETSEEKWSSGLKLKNLSGVRNIRINMKKHIPNFVYIAGYRAFITYNGQPQTCSVCQSVEHLRAACPRKGRPTQLPREKQDEDAARNVSYAGALAGPTSDSPSCTSREMPVTMEVEQTEIIAENNIEITQAEPQISPGTCQEKKKNDQSVLRENMEPRDETDSLTRCTNIEPTESDSKKNIENCEMEVDPRHLQQNSGAAPVTATYGKSARRKKQGDTSTSSETEKGVVTAMTPKRRRSPSITGQRTRTLRSSSEDRSAHKNVEAQRAPTEETEPERASPKLSPEALTLSKRGHIEISLDLEGRDVGEMGFKLRGGKDVTAVREGSPADKAGLRVGDKFIQCNGRDFTNITRDEAVEFLTQQSFFSFLVARKENIKT